MAIAAWTLMAALLLGPPPAPTIEGPVEGPSEDPVEGPARPPEAAPISEPGIEFATEPPESESEPDPTQPTVTAEEPSWPTPGSAPPDGWGFITSAAILLPTTALVTWAVLGQTDDRQDKVAIWATSGVLGAMAIGGLAMGLQRQAKLKRWTLAYRVIAPPQGAGLLTAGGIALNFGVVLVAGGALVLKGGDARVGGTMLGVGIAGLAVIAPLTIYFGHARRRAYQATGGWYRPPLPTVQLAPRLLINDTTFGLGISGRF